MIDGTVDRAWAKHHHPLWISPEEPARDRITARRLPILRVAVVTILLAVTVVWGAGLSHRLGRKVTGVVNAVGELVEHRPLTGAHRDVPELKDCGACHELTGPPPDAKCLACHEGVRPSGSAKAGWHAGFAGRCAGCHRGHGEADLVQLDRAAFNHRRARFDLRGAHRSVQCEGCHARGAGEGAGAGDGRTRWQGLEFGSCADCHGNPHVASPEAECTTCHSEEAWGGRSLRFRHDLDTSFKLTGHHRDAACAQCHEVEFDDPGTDCASCHQTPHQPEFPTNCTKCHTVAGWKAPDVRVDHSAFPLRGAHSSVSCEQCHPAPDRYLGIGTSCADCHEDPHAGSLAPKKCTECHDERTWQQTTFEHDRDSRFALRGAHRALDCSACHENRVFRPKASNCADCHEDPHRGSLAQRSCTACHEEKSWDPVGFDHDRDSRFALDGIHRTLACAQCHESKVFRPREVGCTDCHADAGKALRGDLGVVGRSEVHMRPDPHAGRVDCTDCHDTTRGPADDVEMANRCAKCHTPSYGVLHLDRVRQMSVLLTEVRGPEVDRLAKQAGHDYVPVARRLREMVENRKRQK